MAHIVEYINNMDEEDLVIFLSRRTITYLLDLYRGKHGYGLNLSAKNYIRVLDEKKFIHMYELDLYAYLRIFTTEKCLGYYMSEGLMNKKNMPYLPLIIDELDIDIDILDNYVDQYAYYPDGMGLFDRGIDHSKSNRYLW